ncbi:hypothetical protein [Actinocatenispora rupis]|uniref:hypothetical protein n=1 Tax=Actinocatenispora rupis TaxID=519421 RepID=UPI0019427F7B|nr:hypothetical protein [Actinocatenispora rupis]
MFRPNLYASLAVLGVVGAIAIGLPAINNALPAGRSVAAGQRLTVGRGVTVAAPPDAVLDVTKTQPNLNRLVMSVHSVRVVIEADKYDGKLPGLSAKLRRKIQSNPGYQASQRDHPTSTSAGVPGLQGSYSTPGRIGTYAVFTRGGVGVEVSMAGAGTDVRRDNDTLLDLVRSVRFGAQ